MSPELVRKIMIDNPLATYGRLRESAPGHDPEKREPVFGKKIMSKQNKFDEPSSAKLDWTLEEATP